MITQNLICGPVEIFEVGEPMNMETIREHCEGRKDPVICLTLAALEEIVLQERNAPWIDSRNQLPTQLHQTEIEP